MLNVRFVLQVWRLNSGEYMYWCCYNSRGVHHVKQCLQMVTTRVPYIPWNTISHQEVMLLTDAAAAAAGDESSTCVSQYILSSDKYWIIMMDLLLYIVLNVLCVLEVMTVLCCYLILWNLFTRLLQVVYFRCNWANMLLGFTMKTAS